MHPIGLAQAKTQLSALLDAMESGDEAGDQPQRLNPRLQGMP